MSDVNLEATRAARRRLHDEIRTRDHLLWLLSVTDPGDDAVQIRPYEVHELPEDEPASVAELFGFVIDGTGVPA